MDKKFYFSRWIIHVSPGIMWIVLCPSAYGYAFEQSETQPPENSNRIYTTLDPSVAIVILVLIYVFFILVLFFIYVRHCSESGVDPNASQSLVGLELSGRHGFNTAVIETFPIFLYSEVKDLKIGKGTLECAVCLSEFGDNETLRLLPKCDHVFHPDCIDTWLAFHVTCPVCRAVLSPASKETVKLTDSNNEFNQIQTNSTSELGEDRNQVVIDINNEQSSGRQVIETNDAIPMRNRPLGLGISEKFPRSHSTGHSLVQAGGNTERYTLKLTEEVRKQLMNSVKLKRTASFNVVLAREGSSRGHKYGAGEGSSGGKSCVDRHGSRSDRCFFSVIPPLVSKMGSVNISIKSGGSGEGVGSNSNGRTLLTAVNAP